MLLHYYSLESVVRPSDPQVLPVQVFQAPVAEQAMIFENQNIGVRVKIKKIIAPKNDTIDEKKPSKRGRKSFREMDTELDLINVPDESILAQKLY